MLPSLTTATAAMPSATRLAAAQPLAKAALQRLGLTDRSVRIDPDRNGGDGTCTTHVLDPDTKAVVLFGLEMAPPAADAPFARLGSSVQEEIDEAAGELIVHSVPDASATCSRTDVNVSGRSELTRSRGLTRPGESRRSRRTWSRRKPRDGTRFHIPEAPPVGHSAPSPTAASLRSG